MIIYNPYRESLRKMRRQRCEDKDVEQHEGHFASDHVRMPVSILPKNKHI